jgi:anti-sigma factor RsiW
MTTDARHQEIDELLPWFANGTLEDEERARVERHLIACETCRRELALLRDVGETAAEAVRAAPPVPDALGRTLARIDEWEANRQPSPWARVRAMLDSLFGVSPMPRLVFVAQSALIVVLGTMLVMSRTQEPTFTTASGGGSAEGGVRLTVIFEPAATEASIRQALQAVEATVVSGPSAAGVYVVSLPTEDAESPAVERAIGSLRTNVSVVRFVEREP